MKRKRFSSMLLLVFLVALVLCGTAIAYMFQQTEYKDNQLIPAKVSCAVVEKVENNQKVSIKIQNTGNIDAYLRVNLISYWVDANGDVVVKASVIPEVNLAEGWIEGGNNIYYYTTPVSPENQTAELLASPISLSKDENGYMQVIEVFAEAIQSNPVKAVSTSWCATLDANGVIINVQ